MEESRFRAAESRAAASFIASIVDVRSALTPLDAACNM